MRKGCFYWLLFGIWIEPLLLIFKIPILILNSILDMIIFIFCGDRHVNPKYDDIEDDIEDEKVKSHNNKYDNPNIPIHNYLTNKEKNNMFDREKGIYPSGQYLVGRDIPLGGYVLTSRGNTDAYVQLYPSYKKFKNEEDAITYESFRGDYHIALMEENTYLVVENADVERI